MYDAAEREMDLYRNEVARITAERDHLRADIRALADRCDGMVREWHRSAQLQIPPRRSPANGLLARAAIHEEHAADLRKLAAQPFSATAGAPAVLREVNLITDDERDQP